MIDLSDVLTIVGLVLGLSVQAVITVNWMNTKFDNHQKMINDRFDEYQKMIHSKSEAANKMLIDKSESTDKSLSAVHRRIDDVKDSYVKRVDLDRDLSAMHTVLGSIKGDLNNQTGEVNNRLDRLVKILIDSKPRSQPE